MPQACIFFEKKRVEVEKNTCVTIYTRSKSQFMNTNGKVQKFGYNDIKVENLHYLNQLCYTLEACQNLKIFAKEKVVYIFSMLFWYQRNACACANSKIMKKILLLYTWLQSHKGATLKAFILHCKKELVIILRLIVILRFNHKLKKKR